MKQHTVITYLLLLYLASSCASSAGSITIPPRPAEAMTGSDFYRQAAGYTWQQRDSLALKEILSGNIPNFLKSFVPVELKATAPDGSPLSATILVSPDYLSLGSEQDWARIPLTPMAAQRIADSLGCFLPSRKLVNAIYETAIVKLEPLPLLALRDSTPTFYHHHLMIEGQRQGRKGLVAGHKKDIVISDRLVQDGRPNRVAIYGWHRLNGKPIQPLYTGHVNWYVDYSHGIRLVYRKVKVAGKWLDYTQVMQDPTLRQLLCDETDCAVTRYE